MKNKIKINLKQNKGFTMQDLIIAFGIILLVGGTIGTIYVAIYGIQMETKIEAIATLYAIQITEYIDKIDYDEVVDENTTTIINTVKENFGISDAYMVNVIVIDYQQDGEILDNVKEVKIYVRYNVKNEERNIIFNRLKVKEL